MVGRNAGWAPTQGEILADHLAAEGWEVRETSARTGRLPRLLDTVWCLLRWRHQVDVVVVSVFSGPAFVMADVSTLIARWLGLPVVVWLHGGNLPDFRRRHPRWVARVLRRGAQVVAPSGYLAEDARALGLEVDVVPNVVDLAAIPSRVRRHLAPRILWMRTFHPLYNPRLAVEVLELARRTRPDATLTLAGQDKGAEDGVRALVRERGLEASVTFAGFLDVDAKHEALDGHDIYLHTNDVDNAPVSLLEAAAAGLPIVATDVGGIPHLLDGGAVGLLYRPGDRRAAADAVQLLLEDPDAAERLSRAGRDLAARSAWPAVRTRWTELLAAATGVDQTG